MRPLLKEILKAVEEGRSITFREVTEGLEVTINTPQRRHCLGLVLTHELERTESAEDSVVRTIMVCMSRLRLG